MERIFDSFVFELRSIHKKEISKNAALEEHLVAVKQQLAHELNEKEETVRELRHLKHELASLNVKLSAVELKNSKCFIDSLVVSAP